MQVARNVRHAEHSLGRNGRRIVVAISGFVLSSAGLLAQTGQDGAGELSAYTGFTFGKIATHPAVGVSSGLALSRYAAVLLDLSYLPLGSSTLQYYPSQTLIRNSGLFDLSFSGRFGIPLRDKWEPYAIVGGAVLFSSYKVASSAQGGSVTYAQRGDTDLGFETGAGLRYFVGDKWGVRTELRLTFSNRNFGKMLAGVFYQFDRELDFRPRHYRRSSRHH